MKQKTQARLTLQEGIRNAISRQEFELVYQPQIDLRLGTIFAAEALIRWRHPQFGIVYPKQFIHEAEDTGQIVEIGEWVLNAACEQCQAWHAAGHAKIGVSVNVSARQFMEDHWVERVQQALAVTGLEPRYLDLELTESLIMQDIQQAALTMKRLKEMGVQLSIDDFGTGYSNLSALKSFPVARLKIDRSFIQGIPHDQDDATLAKAIITLGRELNLRTLAEGVDKVEQFNFLIANGCDEYQGYYFSKPVTAAEFLERLVMSSI